MPDALTVIRRHDATLRWSLVGVGALVGLFMVFRSQVAGDQINMLLRGWLLAVQGEWVPFGLHTSAGGLAPGSLTSLLAGLPMMLWQDYRAPALLIWLGHLLAWVVLDRTLGPALGRSGRLLLVALYWMSPWLIYYTGHIWNVNWMFFFGAMHLATAQASRTRPSFSASCLHVVVMGCAFQLHASAPLLGLVSVLLVLGRRVRVSWSGVSVGTGLVALSLLPWAMATLEAPDAVPGETGFIGRGLVFVFPLIRGVVFWLRYGSLSVTNKLLNLDFTPTLGATLDSILAPILVVSVWLTGAASMLLPVLAHFRLWRRRRVLLRRLSPAVTLGSRQWIESYATACVLGALVAFALSPTTIMMWQGFVAFHGAVLPGILLSGALLRSRHARPAARVLVAWMVASVALAAVLSVAGPLYRQGGRRPVAIELASDHPMLHDLGIAQRCTTPIVGPGGYIPDLLRPQADMQAPSPDR